MQTGSIFIHNRSQSVRLPAETRFPENVKKVNVIVRGNERVIVPVENSWDSFFLNHDPVSEDFKPERASQEQQECESF
jgi:antitoxin VapB